MSHARPGRASCVADSPVGAGMRQLWQTGWMQQNIRMLCAAWLCEYLSMHWAHGCRRGPCWLPPPPALLLPCWLSGCELQVVP